jgi:hypothetical protein
VQSLQHERRAAVELAGDLGDLSHPAEREGPPRDVDEIVGRLQLHVRADETEGRKAQAARFELPLDFLGGQQVVVPSRLVARDDEWPALPVVGEELALFDRLDGAT